MRQSWIFRIERYYDVLLYLNFRKTLVKNIVMSVVNYIAQNSIWFTNFNISNFKLLKKCITTAL